VMYFIQYKPSVIPHPCSLNTSLLCLTGSTAFDGTFVNMESRISVDRWVCYRRVSHSGCTVTSYTTVSLRFRKCTPRGFSCRERAHCRSILIKQNQKEKIHLVWPRHCVLSVVCKTLPTGGRTGGTSAIRVFTAPRRRQRDES